MLNFRKQALRLGVTFLDDKALDLDHNAVLTEHDFIDASHIILACGLSFKPLPLDEESHYRNKGLWYGPNVHKLYHGRPIAIIGGANSAGQAAMFYSRFSSQVHLVTRHASLLDTMSDKLVRDIVTRPNITTHYLSGLSSIQGRSSVDSITLNETNNIPVSGLFVCIGQSPHTTWLKAGGIDLDDTGLIKVDESLQTYTVDHGWNNNVYAVGDVRSGSTHRVILSPPDGATV